MQDKIKKHFNEKDKFAKYVGMKIVKLEPGYALAEMNITENHLNGVDIVHGGAIFTLADFAFAAAANSYGQVALSLNANITYFIAARGKILFAEAKEVSSSNKLASYDINIFDENKKLIARINENAYKIEEKLDVK